MTDTTLPNPYNNLELKVQLSEQAAPVPVVHLSILVRDTLPNSVIVYRIVEEEAIKDEVMNMIYFDGEPPLSTWYELGFMHITKKQGVDRDDGHGVIPPPEGSKSIYKITYNLSNNFASVCFANGAVLATATTSKPYIVHHVEEDTAPAA